MKDCLGRESIPALFLLMRRIAGSGFSAAAFARKAGCAATRLHDSITPTRRLRVHHSNERTGVENPRRNLRAAFVFKRGRGSVDQGGLRPRSGQRAAHACATAPPHYSSMAVARLVHLGLGFRGLDIRQPVAHEPA